MRTNCAPTSEVSRFAAVVAAAAPSEHASALAMSIVASARWLELAERSRMARVRVRAQAGRPRATRGGLTPKLSCKRSTQYAAHLFGCTSILIGGNRNDFLRSRDWQLQRHVIRQVAM